MKGRFLFFASVALLLALAAGLGFRFFVSKQTLPPFFHLSPITAPRPAADAIIPNDMLNVADVQNGQQLAKSCGACHSFHEGEARKVGPNLFGIVGARIASRSDFPYSEAMLALRDRIWTTDELYEWLRDPSDYAPGTKMSYGGLADPQDRMDLIAYLMTLK